MQVAEVISTANAYVNKPESDGAGDVASGEALPLGAIKYREASGNARTNPGDGWAIPLSGIKRIPIIGEHVVIVKGPSWSADSADILKSSYYLTSCNIQGNLNLGILPQTYLRGRSEPIGKQGDYINSQGNPQKAEADNPKLGETFQELDTVKPVQPFEGDTIIESRFGSIIRLTSTIEDSPHPEASSGMGLYENPPDWEGGNGPGSPLTIITNGLKAVSGDDVYTIESFEDDNATIMMTSGQKIKTFETAQSNLGRGVDTSNASETPQVIISSDRLVFNAKSEHVIIAAKEDVIVATPDWAAEMNEVHSILNDFLANMDDFAAALEKITNASAPYPTAPGLGNGPTLANPEAGSVAAVKAAQAQLVSRMEALKQ